MNLSALYLLRILFSICLIFIFSCFLQNECKISRYSFAKKNILNNILTINQSIDPNSISNQFIFISNANITTNNKYLSDDILNASYIFQLNKKPVLINRMVSICTLSNSILSVSNKWLPVTTKTKYSPDISKVIFNDINIGNLTISIDIINKGSRKSILIPSKKQIYQEYSKDNDSFIYTYIGNGWFYHMHNGNITRTMLKIKNFFSFDISQIISFIIKIVFSVLFHSFIYINTGTNNAPSNHEMIEKIMSNCNVHDVRMRYLYFAPKGNISIVAFKRNNSLETRKINGFEFGNVINGIARTPEDVIPKYPPGFSMDSLDVQKAGSAFLILILIYLYGSRNKYKRDATIVIFGSIVMLIRAFIWNKTHLMFASSVMLIIASFVFKIYH